MEHIAYYGLRSTVRPGVTGWAQVRYGYANNLEEETEKMRYDLYYIKNRSLVARPADHAGDGRHRALRSGRRAGAAPGADGPGPAPGPRHSAPRTWPTCRSSPTRGLRDPTAGRQ